MGQFAITEEPDVFPDWWAILESFALSSGTVIDKSDLCCFTNTHTHTHTHTLPHKTIPMSVAFSLASSHFQRNKISKKHSNVLALV